MTLIAFDLNLRTVTASMLIGKDLLHNGIIGGKLSYKHARCDSLIVSKYSPKFLDEHELCFIM